MRHLLTPFLLLLLLPGMSCAQESPAPAGNHRWLVEQFFFAPQWPEKTQYYTGEMKTEYASTKTLGEFGAPARRSSLRLVRIAASEAIYAVEIEEGGRAQDYYAYLQQEGSAWRLAAVRTLALPPLFFMILDTLEATKPLPDSLGAMLANMRLTVSPDSTLKAFFLSQRSALETIADGFGRETAGSIAAAPDGLSAPTASLRSLATQLATLHFRGAWRDSEIPACVFLEIGGMIDNEVGFVHCAADAAPSMTPERFILIDPIVPGWYLYKTT